VITAAALCPAAPLMCAELTGDDPSSSPVRALSEEAVAWLVGSGVDVVAVVAVDSVTREWPSTGRADLAPFGGPRLDSASSRVPFGAGLGGRLLDAAGFTGHRRLWTVGPSGGFSVPAADRVGLLVLADGSAHRDLKTSTDVASRAADFDEMVAKSIADGDLSPLLAADPALATELMVTGFPALRVLASLIPAASTSLRYCAAPFGVGYFVATFTPRI
jgi:hypothetical protein